MMYSPTIMSILEVLLVTMPVLLTVAFVTVAESKTMASMQSSLGPNVVGYYGLLQAFADALKLMMKEYISPTQANLMLFFLGPMMTLMFSLLGYAVVPYGPGLAMWDFNLGILYMLAVSSLATYGMLLAGWSANSKYAFLGSLSSTAQLMSYELMLSSAMLLVMLLTGSLNLTVNMEAQSAIWFMLPLFPVFIMFFMGSVAETNSAPFDLAEAESELVSGFMTEHAAVIFVFFFLAEYASMVLICMLNAMLFMGGYLLDYTFVIYILNYLSYMLSYAFMLDQSSGIFSIDNEIWNFLSFPLVEGLTYGLTMGIKSCVMVFIFMWVSASFPSMRFDQLMSFSWTMLLPVVMAFMMLVPCVMYSFEIMSSNVYLF